MKNNIELRPHHFLCLPGYKGYSYNQENINSWDRISQSVKKYPQIRVKIVNGKDTLCKTCPNNKSSEAACNETFLKNLDNKVKALLKMEYNSVDNYVNILNKLKELLDPKKHFNLCGKCQWRVFGLCKDTFKIINNNLL